MSIYFFGFVGEFTTSVYEIRSFVEYVLPPNKATSILPKITVMRYWIFLLTITLLLGIHPEVSGQKQTYICSWQKPPLTIGSFERCWQSALLMDLNTGLYYGVTNDGEFLYVALKTDNEPTIQQILANGLTFTIEAKGKSGNKWTLGFPLPRQEMFSGHYNRHFPKILVSTNSRKRNVEEIGHFNNTYLLGLEMVEITDKKKQKEPVIGYNLQSDGFGVILKIDTTGNLCYEVKIPLIRVFADPKRYLVGAGQFFSFEFLVAAVTGPGQEANRPGRQMMPPGEQPMNQMDRQHKRPTGNNQELPEVSTRKELKIKAKKAMLSPETPINE
ncbi:MAG: hypothetical protein A2W85_10840 [Bacteroidetes bacterium GWF2_41_31]|nr:MAG: hypothetical protein A2W85_10840 [Bacteroidetes bacterium GWF2_41_31]